MDAAKEIFPDYARDIQSNFNQVLTTAGCPGLSQGQIFGAALAAAYATRSPETVRAVLEAIGDGLAPDAIKAAKTAAAMMAMTNVYYRFVHLVSDPDYAAMPSQLKMTALGNPGIAKQDFKIDSLAVSAVNGCAYCVASHAKKLTTGGVSKEGVQSVARIASVIFAASQTFFIEKTL